MCEQAIFAKRFPGATDFGIHSDAGNRFKPGKHFLRKRQPHQSRAQRCDRNTELPCNPIAEITRANLRYRQTASSDDQCLRHQNIAIRRHGKT